MHVQDETESFTQVVATLVRECREWAPGATHAEVETIIEEIAALVMSLSSLTGRWSGSRNLAGPTQPGLMDKSSQRTQWRAAQRCPA